jgi:PadR family transcriptional regulator PadR
MVADGRRTQLLRGVLDICLLAVIAERSRYGYEMVETIAAAGLPLVSEGSIYPLLARLERAGLIESYRESSAIGPPRKYYRLSGAGAEELAATRAMWLDFASAVNLVLIGSDTPRPTVDRPPAKTKPRSASGRHT